MDKLYSYLNLESTKTDVSVERGVYMLYSYLNLESTKTIVSQGFLHIRCTVT